MTRVNATFDGEVFRPDEPVSLPPNTRVELTVGALQPDEADPAETTSGKGEPGCFFRAALSLNLDGPPDWSERFDEYLYGDPGRHDDAD